MTCWISVQVKTVSPSELVPYPEILFTKQTFPRKSWNRVHRTVISQCRCTPRQCPRASIKPAIHSRLTDLTRIYHSNLCRRHCSSSYGQRSIHCFTELQTDLLAIQIWFKKWKMKASESKSIHITFTTRREKCHPVHISNVQLSQEEDVKYFGLHLDRRLTWHKSIFAKRKQLGLTFNKMYWLLGRKSILSTSNKLIYLYI
jgi:hypothetical protein